MSYFWSYVAGPIAVLVGLLLLTGALAPVLYYVKRKGGIQTPSIPMPTLSVALLFGGYFLFLLVLALLFPEVLDAWWTNQPLFWLLQIGILAVILLCFLPGRWKYFGRALGVMIVLPLAIATIQEISKHATTSSPVPADIVSTRNPCKTTRFVAKPGVETRIDGQMGCRWNLQRDPNAGEENYLALATVRPNGMVEHEKLIGQLDGKYHTADYPFRVDYYVLIAEAQPISFISLGVPEKR